jgi:thymidylate kinase
VKLIVFEGCDYTGKTTTARAITGRLSHNWKVTYNTGSIYGLDSPDFYREISPHISELQREALYISSFLMDKKSVSLEDYRVIFQDRYWMSVVAYGKFLNNSKSLHNCVDVSKWMIVPDLVFYLSCSLEEKIRRSKLRGVKSVIDKYVLTGNKKLDCLEREVDSVLCCCPDVVRIDTTLKSVEEVTDIVEVEVNRRGWL